MLRITHEQVAALSAYSVEQFEKSMLRHLRVEFGEEVAALDDAYLRELIVLGIDRAADHGVVSERDVARYIDLMLVYGAYFDEDPELPWARAILEDDAAEDPTEKMDLLSEVGLVYAEAESDVPEFGDESPGNDFEYKLGSFLRDEFAEELAAAREPELLKFVQTCWRRAEAYGITTESGIMHWACLSLLAGHDFHRSEEVHAYLIEPEPPPEQKLAELFEEIEAELNLQ